MIQLLRILPLREGEAVAHTKRAWWLRLEIIHITHLRPSSVPLAAARCLQSLHCTGWLYPQPYWWLMDGHGWPRSVRSIDLYNMVVFAAHQEWALRVACTASAWASCGGCWCASLIATLLGPVVRALQASSQAWPEALPSKGCGSWIAATSQPISRRRPEATSCAEHSSGVNCHDMLIK
jgi:hypothetical protein